MRTKILPDSAKSAIQVLEWEVYENGEIDSKHYEKFFKGQKPSPDRVLNGVWVIKNKKYSSDVIFVLLAGYEDQYGNKRAENYTMPGGLK